MNLLAGREGSHPIFRIATKPAKLLGETAHQIPNAGLSNAPIPPVLRKLSLGIIKTPYPDSLMTGVECPLSAVVVA
jgi:hypothetical protein